MGKSTRNKRQSAQQKIAAQRAAALRAERRRRMLIAVGSVATVLVIVLAFILVRTLNNGSPKPSNSPVRGFALSRTVNHQVTNVSAATLNKVGAGSVPSYNPRPVYPGSGPALTAKGKPGMLYIGAEFCPYCAAARWSMAVALSRFGTLSPLRGIHSAPSPEIYPRTSTLTFYKSSYTSKYLTFTPVENQTVTHAQLQKVTPEQLALWKKFDSSSQGLGYPFIDFGNRYIIKGPLYDPGVLKGLTCAQIAAALHNPSSPVAKGVDGEANYITAAICGITHDQPASACTTPAVAALAKKL